MLNNNARYYFSKLLLIAVTDISVPLNLVFVNTVISNLKVAMAVYCIKQKLNGRVNAAVFVKVLKVPFCFLPT